MLELLTRLLSLEWRREGATLREVDAAGCRVWYAEFRPLESDAPAGPRGERPPRRARGRRSAPTVVLLHGLGASSATFFPVIGALRRGYRVIVPDLPGHGWSRPKDEREFVTFSELVDVVETFVAQVSPAGAYLAGNSMGGWLAAKVAARRPDLARGIALLNPGGPALRAEDWTDFGRVLSSDAADAARQLVARLFHRPPVGARLLGRDIRRLMQGPAVVELVGSLTAEDFVSAEELAAVECPSVLIWGESDRLIPAACRAFFLEKLPRVRHEPIPDCGHCPQLECPRRTAEILLGLSRMRRPAAPERRRATAPRAPASAGARASRTAGSGSSRRGPSRWRAPSPRPT